MKNSAKNSTLSWGARPDERAKLIAKARKFVRDGGSKAAFARDHGVPRTTVIGWCQSNDGPRGRPPKLEVFNESAIFEILFRSGEFKDKTGVRDCIELQCSEMLKRRSLFRYFEKWGLRGMPTRRSNSFSVDMEDWFQPSETVEKNNISLKGKIWRLSSGRGMESFMLTRDDSCKTIRRVATAVIDLLMKKRKRLLLVKHPALAVILRQEMRGWQITESSIDDK